MVTTFPVYISPEVVSQYQANAYKVKEKPMYYKVCKKSTDEPVQFWSYHYSLEYGIGMVTVEDSYYKPLYGFTNEEDARNIHKWCYEDSPVSNSWIKEDLENHYVLLECEGELSEYDMGCSCPGTNYFKWLKPVRIIPW